MIEGIAATMKELRAGLKEFEATVVAAEKRVATQLVENLMANTPVWEGETVRNFGVGVGSPTPSSPKPPIDNGPPGPTNSMPLGSEPRRAPNEAAVRSEVAQALGGLRKLAPVYVTNSSDNWDMVDNGSAPTKDRARYAGGVSARAEQATRLANADILE